ncbi:uncharacterized protein N7482_004150 [Penicillium canariense]|uniref:Uncharacterized protein n=1 Tax=Penicillium canariense TaxID=189055 RepID=A0A9W9I820_9EURO|nr:uncharacterized protein N7482_004150 [Penicillium canariense]KAJ5168556.1 hypothetical protein N7482_004150 [Penicillium canariense]
MLVSPEASGSQTSLLHAIPFVASNAISLDTAGGCGWLGLAKVQMGPSAKPFGVGDAVLSVEIAVDGGCEALLHRDQNTFAQTAATKKWRRRAEDKDKSIVNIITQLPGQSLYEAAYNRLCYDFVIPWPGSLKRLPKLMSTTAPNSCLVSVVAAVAYANFHGRCKSHEAKAASGIHYGRALQKLATTLSDPADMQRDEILMVIFLLGMYEMLTSAARDGTWITHMQGTQSILAHRDNRNLTDEDHYLAILCVHMVIYHVTEAKSPPPHLQHWIQQIPFPMEFKKQLVIIMSSAAAVCAKLREQSTLITAGYPNELAKADLILLEEALAVDCQLQSWSTTLPSAWSVLSKHAITIEHSPSWIRELLAFPGAPEYTYRYSNRLAASDWNACRTTRLRLHLEILDFLSQRPCSSANLTTIKTNSLDAIRTLVTDIAWSVPYALNISPDGTSAFATPEGIPGLCSYMIMWSTFSTLICLQHESVQGQDFAHRAKWFRTVLKFLRDDMGIAKVDVFLQELPEIS